MCYNENMSETNSINTTNTRTTHNLSIMIVGTAIIIMLSFIVWQGWRLFYHRQDNESLSNDLADLSNHKDDASQTNPELGIRAGEQTTEDVYNVIAQTEVKTDNELNSLLAALGIEMEQVWDTNNLQAHNALEEYLKIHPDSPMIPPGTYEAYAIYEGGEPKDLAALRQAGYDISGKAYADGTYETTFLGFQYKTKYDQHYFYFGDSVGDDIGWSEAPYVWDGEVLHVAVHAIDVYLVRTGDV